MRTQAMRHLLFIALVTLWCAVCLAQEYPILHYTRDDGLPSKKDSSIKINVSNRCYIVNVIGNGLHFLSFLKIKNERT